MNGRAFYRNTYLKSEHWQNLRLEKLASVDACCFRCSTSSLSNDVHHTNYRNLYDVALDDLIVLCRPCHELVHEVLDVAKGGDANDVMEMTGRIRAARRNGAAHIPHVGKIFKRLREEAKRPVQVATTVRKHRPQTQGPIAARVMIRLTLGFSGPHTKWPFVALKKVGFIEDLQNAYTRSKPKYKKAFANAIDPSHEYA